MPKKYWAKKAPLQEDKDKCPYWKMSVENKILFSVLMYICCYCTLTPLPFPLLFESLRTVADKNIINSWTKAYCAHTVLGGPWGLFNVPGRQEEYCTLDI